MLAATLAALSALIWGVGDYCGGKATRRSNPLTVALLAEAAGVPVLLVWVAIVGGAPSLGDLLWGAASGVVGISGLVLFYRALAGGAMAVVAPITATTSAAVPLGLGLLIDRTPSPLALAGAALAVVSITLVSLGHDAADEETRRRVDARVVGTSLLAGAAFGLFFALLAQASERAGAWPLLSQRLAGIVLMAGVAAVTRTGLRVSRPNLMTIVCCGTFDVVASALYLYAVHHGELSLVGPIASLYPASTVLLALVIDRERVRPIQVAGLGLAAAALVLTAT